MVCAQLLLSQLLATAEEWLILCFPVDSDVLARVDPSEASFTAPIK